MSSMEQIAASPYLEMRNGGYYVAGSMVSLASVVHAFRRGASPETTSQEFPQIGALAQIYGVITFILEKPEFVEAYLVDQERLWNELERQHPLPPDMLARFEKGREVLKRRSA